MKASYDIDPAHSSAQFSVRHMMITNVRGGFSSVKGTIVYDPDDPGATSWTVTVNYGDTSGVQTLEKNGTSTTFAMGDAAAGTPALLVRDMDNPSLPAKATRR